MFSTRESVFKEKKTWKLCNNFDCDGSFGLSPPGAKNVYVIVKKFVRKEKDFLKYLNTRTNDVYGVPPYKYVH